MKCPLCNYSFETTKKKIRITKAEIKAFVKDVNKALAPIAKIIQTQSIMGVTESFDIVLNDNPYFRTDQIVVTENCYDMIKKYGEKHFKQEPSFNNTGRCFWFYNA